MFLAISMTEKEFRFTEKKVDESWKDAVQSTGKAGKTASAGASTHPLFSNFISSLGAQALIHMGELKTPGIEQNEINLAVAQEIIDLLVMLKDKTGGNLSTSEAKLLDSLIADLQLKFVERRTG